MKLTFIHCASSVFTMLWLLVSCGQSQLPKLEKSAASPTDSNATNPHPIPPETVMPTNSGSASVPVPGQTPNPSATGNPATAQITWVAAQNGSIPAQAVQMTLLDGKPAFLCRAQMGGHTLIGPIFAGGSCFLPHDFKRQTTANYEVLTLSGASFEQVFSWLPLTANPSLGRTLIPANGFAAGQMQEVSTTTQLYPCLVDLGNKVFAMGKTGTTMRGCFYMNGQTEAESPIMLILSKISS